MHACLSVYICVCEYACVQVCVCVCLAVSGGSLWFPFGVAGQVQVVPLSGQTLGVRHHDLHLRFICRGTRRFTV